MTYNGAQAAEARQRLAEFASRLRDARRSAPGPWVEVSLGALECGELEMALRWVCEVVGFAVKGNG